MLDLRVGFLVKNFVYSRLETSGNPKFDETITKLSFGKAFFYLISGLYKYVKSSRHFESLYYLKSIVKDPLKAYYLKYGKSI